MRNIDSEKILKGFNKRDKEAFCEVYSFTYNELYIFAERLYFNTNIDVADVIHDIFAKLWERNHLKFESLDKLKGYLYISIRNRFRDFLSKKSSEERYSKEMLLDEDNLVANIVEIETLSLINQAMKQLPEECLKVLQLVVEGWEVGEIAVKLGKSPSTVYTQKTRALDILKKNIGGSLTSISYYLTLFS